MTFDLSPEQQTARDEARNLARTQVAPAAAAIDRDGAVPRDLIDAAAAVIDAAEGPLARTLAIEAIATESAAVALAAAARSGRTGSAPDLAGLRGAPGLADGPLAQLILAAAALGIGEAAVRFALDRLREDASRPGDGDRPHWVVADVATEMEAARLLTYRAAHDHGTADAATEIAVARLLAGAAAARAVEAAIRVGGGAAYERGGPLDRLARDVRAVGVMLGTEEHMRATAAEGLLPG